MTFSDARFGAEVVTAKGKAYKFDDTHCLLAFLKEGEDSRKSDEKIYFVSFSGAHSLIASGDAMLLKSDQLRSPMGGNIAAFENKDSLAKVQITFPGEVISWKDIAIQ
jgi:copper chaperone NosL